MLAGRNMRTNFALDFRVIALVRAIYPSIWGYFVTIYSNTCNIITSNYLLSRICKQVWPLTLHCKPISKKVCTNLNIRRFKRYLIVASFAATSNQKRHYRKKYLKELVTVKPLPIFNQQTYLPTSMFIVLHVLFYGFKPLDVNCWLFLSRLYWSMVSRK